MAKLNLIVLRTAEIVASLNFYKTLGLEFKEEQHGTSTSVHFSSEIDGTTLEIFPGKPGKAPDRKQGGAIMLGFEVANLSETITTLQSQGIEILTAPEQQATRWRAVVQDPDGRAVELTQKVTNDG